MSHYTRAIDYVARNIDDEDVQHARMVMERERVSLYKADPVIYDRIYDLMEEYGENEGLGEGWWCQYTDDPQDIFLEL